MPQTRQVPRFRRSALRSVLAAGFLFFAPVALGVTPDPVPAVDLSEALSVDPSQALIVGGELARARGAITRFYGYRNHQPAWTGPDNRGRRADLLAAIADAKNHGLPPADYHLSVLAADEEGDTLAFEILATDAYLTLAAHYLDGRVDSESFAPKWSAVGGSRDLANYLAEALEQGRIRDSLAALAPVAPEYQVLRRALAHYEKAAATPAGKLSVDGPSLSAGMAGPSVLALRERLEAIGVLAPAAAPGALYDEIDVPETPDRSPADYFDAELTAAVARFQRQVGIEPSGVADSDTLKELNVDAGLRADNIKAAMERWRWLARDLGERHIRVNIADFRLEARSGSNIVRAHDVIIGQTYRRTPVFSDEITYLVFNPWWETPSRLARRDKLPDFQKNPTQVTTLGFQILDGDGNEVSPHTINWADYSDSYFPFRIRQRPGPLNALGQVKMIFPNRYNVYLHDTPSRELFDRDRRAFSSGCIRVRDPMELAEWVMAETPGWDRSQIDNAVMSGEAIRADLSQALPIHVLYLTVIVNPDGTFRFVPDLYKKDAELIEALKKVPTAKEWEGSQGDVTLDATAPDGVRPASHTPNLAAQRTGWAHWGEF